MLDICTTCIKKQYHVNAKQVVQKTIKCHHFMYGLVKREKLEMSGGMSDSGCWRPAEPQPQPRCGWGEDRSVCH